MIKKLKNKILQSESYGVGKKYVSIALQNKELVALHHKLCKKCKKRAKKAAMKKNFNHDDGYECLKCDEYIKRANKLSNELAEKLKKEEEKKS